MKPDDTAVELEGPWMKDLQPEDLPELYRIVAEEVGVLGALRICRRLGGFHRYFPKFDEFGRKIRDAHIRQDYSAGKNVSQLARENNLTEYWVRRIVTGIEDDRQLTLMDLEQTACNN